jgi:DNA-directed RNA polymerase subunit K
LRYTRFEKARIIGARALQISLGAPVLIEKPKDLIDPLQIAMQEFEVGTIPIVPKRKEVG